MLDLSKKPYYLADEQIQQLQSKVQTMTLDEKIGQLFFVIGQDEDQVDIKEFIKTYRPGGMMYRPASAEKIKRRRIWNLAEMGLLQKEPGSECRCK